MSDTDLCTIEQVKLESAGRITDADIDPGTGKLYGDITYKITDLSEKLLEIDPTLTIENRTARQCTIYGVLAWLVLNKKIKQNKQISSFKSGNMSINFTNNNTKEDNESSDCKIYQELKRGLLPKPPVGARTRRF